MIMNKTISLLKFYFHVTITQICLLFHLKNKIFLENKFQLFIIKRIWHDKNTEICS